MRKTYNFSLIATVGFLYLIFVSIMFIGFSSYVYRSSWQESLSRGANPNLSIEDVLFSMRVADNWKLQIESVEEQIDQESTALEADKATLTMAKASAASLPADLRSISTALDKISLSLDVAIDRQTEKNEIKIIEYEIQRSDLLMSAAQSVSSTKMISTIEEIEQNKVFLDTLASVPSNLERAAAYVEQREDSLSRREKQLADLRGKFNKIEDMEFYYDNARARLDSLSSSVPEAFAVLLQGLVTSPTIFLTLIVTIAAGGLGSIVKFSRSLRRDPEFPGCAIRLLFSLGEGIAAAFGVFLLSGASVMALSSGAGSASGTELSPYTVAFIAFVSGLMSEDAFFAIQEAGKRAFKTKRTYDN